jgi:hypothetical protein
VAKYCTTCQLAVIDPEDRVIESCQDAGGRDAQTRAMDQGLGKEWAAAGCRRYTPVASMPPVPVSTPDAGPATSLPPQAPVAALTDDEQARRYQIITVERNGTPQVHVFTAGTLCEMYPWLVPVVKDGLLTMQWTTQRGACRLNYVAEA